MSATRPRSSIVVSPDQPDRGIVSSHERRQSSVRRTIRVTEVGLLGFLLVVGLGPLLWLAKAAITPTRDTLRQPMALWPNGFDFANLSTAWNQENLDHYFLNTVFVAGGSWAGQMLVATTAGYALSVLRPRYGKLLTALVLGTMLVPSVVLLVPLYLTVLDVPGLDVSLINSFWAVWLPAAASPFNVILVKRFFDNLPREVFEAAMVDGAGPFRLFWSIVLPMSRPILGVVSVFAVVAAWKDFLWPLLVLPDPAKQPLSVRLPVLADLIQLDVLLAALFLSTLIPVVLFLVFQRFFLRGAGLSGAVKG
ncbi:carbohydrate ABC transporter permease [Kineosporia rhizophila]|uniref:carbohydrate ABC transporter permease n=1 Tax=Kineosporia TaxID=49184 RepID=UPI001E2BEBFE|nr:carbohydrate ABC transporter permease [Kineosporia sp. NBRC 101677]MCE0540039.1 carbohydrate ABC transporter permease [Kineosporia rhizophila]